MDHTANLRRIKGAIDKMQDGEQYLNQQNFAAAATNFDQALRIAPNDYPGLVLMAKAHFGLDEYAQAVSYSELAKRIQPQEAQAHYISGISKLALNRFDLAYQDFVEYEQFLPGQPNTIFLKGLSLEGMQQRDAAAQEYARFLGMAQKGGQAQHAYQRLMSWGYLQ
jgi:tetratricopeptide (TPR) repeat protein